MWQPCCFLQRDWSHKSDVFSFGVTLWEIKSKCCHRPYPSSNDRGVEEILSAVYRGDDIKEDFPHAGRFEDDFLMRKCWARQPEERPDFQRILKELETFDDDGNEEDDDGGEEEGGGEEVAF